MSGTLSIYLEREQKRKMYVKKVEESSKIVCPNCNLGYLKRDKSNQLYCPTCHKEVNEQNE
jgi:rubrerythrin